MRDFITIGAATKDVFLASDQFQLLASERFETGVGECVALGSKIEIDSLVQTTGGGATNAAVTFARLGFAVAAACKIGADSAGKDVLAALKRERVAASLVTVDPKRPTAYSTLLTTSTGERTVLVYRGASASFGPKDVPVSRLAAKWLYLTSLGGNVALATKIISAARGSAAWNPGGNEIAAGLNKLMPAIRRTRVLILNREEASRLTGASDIPAILAALTTGENAVVVTDGPRGAHVRQGGATLFAPGTGKPAKSQTGAGDAFGSGFVAALAKTGDVRAALAVATLNAESVIGKVGAKAGILRAWPSKAQVKSIKIQSV